jgi:uncharacterized protein YoxC
MSTGEIISIVASIASVVLAIIAIWLSIVFYKLSTTLSEDTKEAAKGIMSSVERLEKLFDKLYTDTFSIMKETVDEMRKHAWSEGPSVEDKMIEDTEKKLNARMDALKNEVGTEISKLLSSQHVKESIMPKIEGDLRGLIDKAIVDARRADTDARKELLRRNIIQRLRIFRGMKFKVTADRLIRLLSRSFERHEVLRELDVLKDENVVFWEGNIEPETIVELKKE